MTIFRSLFFTCFTSVVLFSSSVFGEELSSETKPIKEVKKIMKPSVKIETNHGDITLELYSEKAPITVKNFLGYVDEKFYDGTVFHRVISNFMVQGGGMELKDGRLSEKTTKAPITNESTNGIKNNRGTVAMARRNDLDSATSQFFINVVDNDGLNHGGPYGGYAVFAKVTEGMDVVDVIRKVKTKNNGGHGDVPVEEVKIISISRVEG